MKIDSTLYRRNQSKLSEGSCQILLVIKTRNDFLFFFTMHTVVVNFFTGYCATINKTFFTPFYREIMYRVRIQHEFVTHSETSWIILQLRGTIRTLDKSTIYMNTSVIFLAIFHNVKSLVKIASTEIKGKEHLK